MSLSGQIIDQRVTGIVQEQSDAFDNELRVGIDEPRRRSVAFVFLVAKTAFDLTDEQTVDGIVDGGNDFGVDALYCDSPEDGEIRVNLVQGKYRGDLRGDAAFPENGIVQMIDAGHLESPIGATGRRHPFVRQGRCDSTRNRDRREQRNDLDGAGAAAD